jgi:hypothetical protein
VTATDERRRLFGPAESMRWALRALKGDPAAQERHAEFYEAMRQVYADGGALDDDALDRLAVLHDVPEDLAVRIRSRAHVCGWGLASAPTGAQLLAQVRDQAAQRSTAQVLAPLYTSLQRYRRSPTGD